MATNYFSKPLALPNPRMSTQDLCHNYKTSFNMGSAVPFYVEEVLPRDRFRLHSDIFLRLAPMYYPIMHHVKVRTNFFFVPSRLVLGDDMTQEFYGTTSHELPRYVADPSFTDMASNSLFDYMGCQPKDYERYIPNPLPFFMYQLIWSEYYADEVFHANQIAAIRSAIDRYRAVGLDGTYVPSPTAGVSDVVGTLRQVCWSKDYFTCAQYEPQRGDPVYLMNPLHLVDSEGQPLDYSVSQNLRANPQSDMSIYDDTLGDVLVGSDLTIEELWDKMAIQRWQVRNNKFGTRYVEQLAGHFGVVSSDARLQRPQWLGGSQCSVQISEVLQSSATESDSPLGAMAGRGVAARRTRNVLFTSEEHGYLFGIVTVVPDNGYTTGNPRWFYKSNSLDYAFPEFVDIGEQPVYKGEVFSDNSEDFSAASALAVDLEEFGYQPRYSEYRQHRSLATGDFRRDPLLRWHLNRVFAQVPPLNSGFVEVRPSDTLRIFNDTSDDDQHLYLDAYINCFAHRPISYYPNPDRL